MFGDRTGRDAQDYPAGLGLAFEPGEHRAQKHLAQLQGKEPLQHALRRRAHRVLSVSGAAPDGTVDFQSHSKPGMEMVVKGGWNGTRSRRLLEPSDRRSAPNG